MEAPERSETALTMASENAGTHHLRKSIGASVPVEEAYEHELLLPETQRLTSNDTHIVDVPESLSSVISKGKICLIYRDMGFVSLISIF